MKVFYQNKTILITGASSGIGYDLALFLAPFKTKLILTARRKNKLEALKQECEKRGATVMLFDADVTNKELMQRLGDEALEKFGFVDIVIANAGVGCINPANKFSLEINKQVFDINLNGMANTFVPFIKSMIKEKKGHLIGISSLAAFRGLPKVASYSASKSAQRIFLESFRLDLKKYGISVSSIHPGFIKTPMTNHTDFTMPFMVPVRKSSKLIAKAIMKKKKVYLYPWQMRYLTYLNRIMPKCIYDRLIPKLSGQKDGIEAKIM